MEMFALSCFLALRVIKSTSWTYKILSFSLPSIWFQNTEKCCRRSTMTMNEPAVGREGLLVAQRLLCSIWSSLFLESTPGHSRRNKLKGNKLFAFSTA